MERGAWGGGKEEGKRRVGFVCARRVTRVVGEKSARDTTVVDQRLSLQWHRYARSALRSVL